MTDCNVNQLVLKVHVEPPPAQPVPSSPLPVTSQPPPTQPAPNLQPPTNVSATTEATAACTRGGSNPTASVESPANLLDAVGKPAPLEDTLHQLAAQNPDVQLEEARHIQVEAAVRLPVAEPLGIDASLSDLDRIGMGVRITQTMRANGVPIKGKQPSTSGAPATQMVSTHQEVQGLLTCEDIEDLDILDLGVDGSEDFSDTDPELADELLGEDPEKMIGSWVTMCNQKAAVSPGDQTHPDLESGFRSLDLNNKGAQAAGAATGVANASTATASPTMSGTQSVEKIYLMDGQPKNIPAQPGLTLHQRTFEIEGVAVFRRHDGQPLHLNAYPPVVKLAVPPQEDPDQAYRGQDLVNPTAIRARHTRKERLQQQEEEQRKRLARGTLPTSVGLAGVTKRTWYSEDQLIEPQTQPWEGDASCCVDYDTLAMCDCKVTTVTQQSHLIPMSGLAPALVSPVTSQ